MRELAAGRYIPSSTASETEEGCAAESGQELRTSSSLVLPPVTMALPQTKAMAQRMAQTLTSIAKASNKLPNTDLHVFPADWRYAESFQLARYGQGEYYGAHADFSTQAGYDRVATFLVYLSDAHDGGETIFPYLRGTTDADKAAEGQMTYEWNKQRDFTAIKCESRNETLCGKGGPGEGYDAKGLGFCCCAELLRLRPREGDAVLFFPVKKDGSKEKLAMHASCPVIYGDGKEEQRPKEIMQQWFHAEPVERSGALHPKYARRE